MGLELLSHSRSPPSCSTPATEASTPSSRSNTARTSSTDITTDSLGRIRTRTKSSRSRSSRSRYRNSSTESTWFWVEALTWSSTARYDAAGGCPLHHPGQGQSLMCTHLGDWESAPKRLAQGFTPAAPVAPRAPAAVSPGGSGRSSGGHPQRRSGPRSRIP